MSKWVNVGGTWRQVVGQWVNVGGTTWRQITNEWVNVGGTWRQSYSSSFLAPTNLYNYASSSTSITVLWNASTPTSGYTVTYDVWKNSTGVAPTPSNLATAGTLVTGLTGTSYNNTGSVTTGTTYFYWVRAVETNGTTTIYTSWSGYTAGAATAASTSLSISSITTSGSSSTGYSATVFYTNSSTISNYLVNITDSAGGTKSPTSFGAYALTSSGATSATVALPSTWTTDVLTATSQDGTVTRSSASISNPTPTPTPTPTPVCPPVPRCGNDPCRQCLYLASGACKLC